MSETVKLSTLIPDGKNANLGSPRGNQMIEDSLRQYGAGRSILLDKHGRIIAGNKTAEKNGRIAYGTELSPAYCDVIVTRWENATGKKAVLSAGS
jgi:hypothetical protein